MFSLSVVARVTLEIALRKEFDYAIPAELAARIEVGTRVKVPFGPRQVNGLVTSLSEESTHTNLRPIAKVISAPSLVTAKVLQLARWIGDYYCCAPEVALRSVLPEAVRKEDANWRERLFVRVAPRLPEAPKLTSRQQDIFNIIEEWRELPLQRLLTLSGATPATIRKLDDKGLITIAAQIDERDPYAHEQILATEPLNMNPEQAAALGKIKEAMFSRGGTRVSRVASGVPPDTVARKPVAAITEPTARRRHLPHFEVPGSIYHVTWKTHDQLALSPEARRRTLEACSYWHGRKMKCYIACVMPDHVHLLLQPTSVQESGKTGVHSLSEILHSIKSFSAHEVNKVMKRSGSVWQEESFDRMIRSESDLHEKWNYIWDNAWRAGPVGIVDENPFVWTPGTEEQIDHSASRRDAEKDPRDAGATRNNNSTFLLHGVTGSGKTEVYLQAIAHALEKGQGAIVLVPEISLTPQTVERFKARFSSGPLRTLVAVLHSHLSAGERHDEWHKIRQGRARIVIGARSAIFAPVDPLGLIIVDEEHEHSYKQEEAPRYHARDVAVVRGQMEGAVVVLGSATPSMESFYNAQRGKYQLLELTLRVDDQKMPVVRVIDMRAEGRKQKGIPIFSHQLKEAITQRLERHEQTILFLNRRGYSTSLLCPQCGYVASCPNCSVSLTFHRRAAKLLCHICGHSATAPTVCPEPKCRNPAIRYSGLGTEKVEDTLTKLFPHARITRMDSDTLKKKDDYRRILGDFRAGKIDVLVGTQMIAKGLHFPNVTLVGIIYADLSLHIPDFRAGERTFQLLTQVAGRAGRGDVEGEVFVQAFTPFHPAIQYARRHDFIGFYEQEIEFREQLKYPPLSRIALLTLRGRNEDKVRLSAEHVRGELEKLLPKRAPGILPGSSLQKDNTASTGEQGARQDAGGTFADLVIAGPAPAPLARAETFYRFQLMVRTRAMTKLGRVIARLQETLALPEDVRLSIDIDPVDLS